MATDKFNKYWTAAIIILVAVITISSIVAWSKHTASQPIEISIPPTQELQGEIYIGGAVNNPGFYSLRDGDSIEALIRAAGGTADSADLSHLELYIPPSTDGEQPQKIDLNRAEAWLLESLPGIGETLAQRIVDYRQQNGPFHDTNELLNVAGIGATSYEQIKNLITVAD